MKNIQNKIIGIGLVTLGIVTISTITPKDGAVMFLIGRGSAVFNILMGIHYLTIK